MSLRLSIDSEFPMMEFNSDDEFTDFCLAPYAVVKQSDKGNYYYTGVYSDRYLKCVEEGVHFLIRDEDSLVTKRRCVTKRLPLMSDGMIASRRDVLVQMPVENLEDFYI